MFEENTDWNSISRTYILTKSNITSSWEVHEVLLAKQFHTAKESYAAAPVKLTTVLKNEENYFVKRNSTWTRCSSYANHIQNRAIISYILFKCINLSYTYKERNSGFFFSCKGFF